MNEVNTLLVSGYRPYELNIFNENQREVIALKKFLKAKLMHYCETGTNWIIIQGYTGFEMYAAQVVIELKRTYNIHLALLMPFHEFESRYKENELETLQFVKENADFKKYIFERPYQNPNMFKQINQFLIDHSDGALIFYDMEVKGKIHFLYNEMLEFNNNHPYNIERIDFDEVNSFIDFFE